MLRRVNTFFVRAGGRAGGPLAGPVGGCSDGAVGRWVGGSVGVGRWSGVPVVVALAVGPVGHWAAGLAVAVA